MGVPTMTVAGMTQAEPGIQGWIRHGVIGGIVAGLVFAAFEMVVAAIMMGADAFFMPLRMIGAMLLGEQALDPGFSLVTAAAAGVGVHMVLSIVYGIAVAGAARFVPAVGRSGATLVLFASAAGLALWLINFAIEHAEPGGVSCTKRSSSVTRWS
jgi:hypothetical protein